MSAPTSEEMARRGRLGALTQWAAEPNWSARTAPARAGAEARFDRMVIEKHGELPAAEHAKYREIERRLYYAELSRKGVKARRASAGLA